MPTKSLKAGLVATAVVLGACSDDDPTDVMMPEAQRFTVSIENVSEARDFLQTGVFNTPEGAAAPGPLMPGASYMFDFFAAPGHRLSFATMFVQSNDLFYAPDGAGIELYDGEGNPRSGDITAEIALWDAGTEIDQEPGLGMDQAPRQGGADAGAADPNPNVRLAEDTFDNLPMLEQAIRVTLTHLGGGMFEVRISNIATDLMIDTSDGGEAPILLAPGVYTVGSGMDALFTEGSPDRGEGLEAIAEDGAPGGLYGVLDGRTGLASPLAPGVFAVHMGSGILFDNGTADRGQGLEALAEDGDPSALVQAVMGNANVSEAGAFNTPTGAAGPGPLFPGQTYTFEFEAMEGDYLSLATMFVQSNDLFYAPGTRGIPLFMNGSPVSGDITDEFLLWDAGTEVNEYPGVGMNQAPRQSGPDTGADEVGEVTLVNDGFVYPSTDRVLRVTITPIN